MFYISLKLCLTRIHNQWIYYALFLPTFLLTMGQLKPYISTRNATYMWSSWPFTAIYQVELLESIL